MFYSVKEGGSSVYGISYLVDDSLYRGRFVFRLLFPWFGKRYGDLRVYLPNPFRKACFDWPNRTIRLSVQKRHHGVKVSYEPIATNNNN